MTTPCVCVCVCVFVCVCVCVGARARAQEPSGLSSSINQCTYNPLSQKPCLFTIPHKLVTLWTLSSLAQLTFIIIIIINKDNNKESPPFTTIHIQPFAPSLATCQVFFQQAKHVVNCMSPFPKKCYLLETNKTFHQYTTLNASSSFNNPCV